MRKNKLLFVLTAFLITASILYGINLNPTTKQTISTKDYDSQLKMVSFYKKENHTRYIKYQSKNKNLNIEQIITNVNIGLDTPQYTNIKESNKLNNKLILVNKYISLPSNYIPENLELIDEKYSIPGMKLVKGAKNAFEKMAAAAKKENLKIIAMSTYRSYSYQETLYNKYVKQDGQELADTYSARPGHSEHQTGLAVDIYNGNVDYTEFENTKEFEWMQQNAYKYGFILRYPKDKTKTTGYTYESWHYRYVGPKIAKIIYNENITYDEYYIQNLDK